MSLEELSDRRMTKAFVVTYNADGTEGRGPIKIKAICRTRATAMRLASGISTQGSDGDIEEIELIECRWSHGWYYGPVNLVEPSREDEDNQKFFDKIEAVKKKALDAGLSIEDIKLLRLLM